MPLCETVAMLIDRVMDCNPNALPEDQRWASTMRSIVEYRDRRRLDEWESLVNDAAPIELSTPLQEMLGEIEMLGMCNLYQTFDVARTTEFYKRLCPYFSARGVSLPTSPDLDDW